MHANQKNRDAYQPGFHTKPFRHNDIGSYSPQPRYAGLCMFMQLCPPNVVHSLREWTNLLTE